MAESARRRSGFIGGTGPEGMGLALRLAAAGYPVIVGSRDAERGRAGAAQLVQQLDAAGRRAEAGEVTGGDNLAAVQQAEIVFLTVPYGAQQAVLSDLAQAIGSKLLVNTVAPMAFEGGRPRALQVPGGSAAAEAQALLPDAKVIAALHHVSARHLSDLSHPLEGDVLVCGDNGEAKQEVMALVTDLEALRPVDAGGLDSAHPVEALTAVLLTINRRYRTLSSVRIIGP